MLDYMDNPSAPQPGSGPFVAAPPPREPPPQPAPHPDAPHVPGPRPAGKSPRKLVWVIIAAVIIIAAAALAYSYMGGHGQAPAAGSTTQQPSSGVTLGSVLSATNSSGSINVTYAGSAYISAGGNLTLPFSITMQRSGQNSTASVSAENMTLQMFKYGGLYYDCLVPSNGVRTCYNETVYAANYSAAVLASSGTLVSQVLGNASYAQVSTSQRSYNGATCTFFDVNLNGTDMSGCVSQATGLVMNLSLRSSSSGAVSTYSASMSHLGAAVAPSQGEFLNVSSSSGPGISGSSLAYLNLYALAVPISTLDALILPEAAMAELGAFSAQSYAPQACVATPGFECAGAAYSNGTLSFTFGQATGSQWSNTVVYFVAPGSPLTANSPSYAIGSAVSGRSIPVSIQVPANALTGNQLVGTLYGSYDISGAPQNATEIGTLSVNAT